MLMHNASFGFFLAIILETGQTIYLAVGKLWVRFVSTKNDATVAPYNVLPLEVVSDHINVLAVQRARLGFEESIINTISILDFRQFEYLKCLHLHIFVK